MAISAVNSLENHTDSAGTGFTTASYTPTANALILLGINCRNSSSTEPTISSVSGNGLTWVSVGSVYYDNSSGSRKKLFLYRAMGSSPSAGAITVSFGQTNSHYTWVVDQVTGVDTGGTNGSGAVVQSATNSEIGGNGGVLTVTLAAFASANNGTYGVFGDDSEQAATIGSGFTELGRMDSTSSEPFIHGLISEYKTTNDTSVDMTFAAVVGASTGGIAIEIKQAEVSTSVKDLIGGFIAFPRS